MCTAVTFKSKSFYFGRTLDSEFSYGENICITPRNFVLNFRSSGRFENHYAITGVALAAQSYPLYFDAFNEKGLCMAGLNFIGNAHYTKAAPKSRTSANMRPATHCKDIAQWEFIPYILGKCSCISEALKELENINITDEPFSEKMPCAELHWLIADKDEAYTVEQVKEGLKIYRNEAGVLTNNPPFDFQMSNLGNYLALSSLEPVNTFCEHIDLKSSSLGTGAVGLPGDWSSQSRFVRAAFVRNNSVSRDDEEHNVSQFFHILDTVTFPRGCCKTGSGYEITHYSSCCNAEKGVYYYTTYNNRSINAVDMNRENLEGNELIYYPLNRSEKIFFDN